MHQNTLIGIAVAAVVLVSLYMFAGVGGGHSTLAAASAPPPAPGTVAAAVASVTGSQGTTVHFREKAAPVNPDGSKVKNMLREDNHMPLTSISGGAKSVPQQRAHLAPINTVNETVGNHKRLVANLAAVPKSVAGVDTVADAQHAYLIASGVNQALISDLGQAHESRSNARHFGLKAGSDNAWHMLMQQNGLEADPAEIVRKNGCGGFNTEMAMRLPSHHPCFQEMLNTVQADQPSRIRA